MKKVQIDIYAVTNQKVYDDEGNLLIIEDFINQLNDQIENSIFRNRVEVTYTDVLTQPYDETMAKENLEDGLLLPWTYVNGELAFYNGISENMILQEVADIINFTLVRK